MNARFRYRARIKNVAFVGIIVSLISSQAAFAYDFGKVRRKPAAATFDSHMPIFELERCLMDLDMPTGAFVYRAPDRPLESVVYWQSADGPLIAELVDAGEKRIVSIKARVDGQAVHFTKRFLACA